MAELGEIQIPLRQVVGRLTMSVTVTGMTRWRIAMWVGLKLLQLAAAIIGTKLKVDLVDGTNLVPAERPSLAIPPSRLSVADLERPDCPVTWAEAQRIMVTLEGEEITGVTGYDCLEGWVERYETDAAGSCIIRDGNLVPLHLTGNVAATYRPEAS